MMQVCFKTISDFCAVASKLIKTGVMQVGSDLKSRDGSSGVISAPLGLEIEPLCIDLARFCAVVKKLKTETLDLDFEPTRITLKVGGTRVVFPTLAADTFESPLSGIPVWQTDWPTALADCEASVETTERFGGVLIDTTGECARVVKLNNFAIALRTITGIPQKVRLVVPSAFVKNTGGPADVLFGGNFFGLKLENGVTAYTTVMHDMLPQNYLTIARLADTPDLVAAENYDWYAFDKQDLLEALKVEGAAMGDRRTFIDFEFVRDGERMVCNLKSQDFGYEVSQVVECREFKSDRPSDLLGIKGSDLLSTLSHLGDRIVVYNDGTGPILVGSAGRLTVFSRA